MAVLLSLLFAAILAIASSQKSDCEINCNKATKGECENVGCTWNPLKLPPCFGHTDRIRCESDDVSETECLQKGCLYTVSSEGYPYCYYPIPPGSKVKDNELTCVVSCEQPNESKCLENGCLWNDAEKVKCYKYTPRVVCQPNSVGEEACLNIDGCVWKQSNVTFEPWCYFDNTPDYFIDCHPDPNPTEERCQDRNCLWYSNVVTPGAPKCIFRDSVGYKVTEMSSTSPKEYSGTLQRETSPAIFGTPYDTVTFETFNVVESSVGFLSISANGTAATNRKPPAAKSFGRFLGNNKQTEPEDSEYSVEISQSPFGIRIRRNCTGFVVFDTTEIPGLAVGNGFSQISTRIQTRNIYGFGELAHTSLRHEINWRKFGIWNHDVSPDPKNQPDMNLYGFHPFYLGLEPDGKAHGIFLEVPEALNVAIQPDPDLITYRSNGDQLDFYWFLGSSPAEVIEMYTRFITKMPLLPPFWGLGYQLSRYGYHNTSEIQAVYERNQQLGLPMDIFYADIDYMDRHLDFTLDPVHFADLPAFTDKLHTDNRKLVLITDPGIGSSIPNRALELGIQYDAFIKNSTGQYLTGKVWPGDTYFPDFTKENTTAFWTEIHKEFHDKLAYDGMWYDMNEPSNFVDGSTYGCENNSINYPDYNPLIYDSDVIEKTICNDAQTSKGSFGHVHSSYGFGESHAGFYAAPRYAEKKRPFILSRSTAPGSGTVAAHWSGDVFSDYDGMRYSVINMLEFGMFGIPWVGTDICGFHDDADEELCIRWHQLGSFYPFCRNHNDLDRRPQDPASWSPEGAANMVSFLTLRYALLPTLYSQMVISHLTGRPTVRPMFFDFNTDPETYGIDDQFMIGSGMLAAPVMTRNATERTVYLPEGRWYKGPDTRTFIDSPGGYRQIQAPLFEMPVFVRGGSIITAAAVTDNLKTTEDVRKSPFAISAFLDHENLAYGYLFWDDGESLYSYEHEAFHAFEIYASVSCGGATGAVVVKRVHFSKVAIETPPLDSICVTGTFARPTNFTLQGNPMDNSYVSFSDHGFCANGLNEPFMLEQNVVFSFK